MGLFRRKRKEEPEVTLDLLARIDAYVPDPRPIEPRPPVEAVRDEPITPRSRFSAQLTVTDQQSALGLHVSFGGALEVVSEAGGDAAVETVHESLRRHPRVRSLINADRREMWVDTDLEPAELGEVLCTILVDALNPPPPAPGETTHRPGPTDAP